MRRSLTKLTLLLAAVAALSLGAQCGAQDASVETGSAAPLGSSVVTSVSVPEADQVEINGQGLLQGAAYPLSNPPQIVVDVENAVMSPGLETNIGGSGSITSVEVQQVPNAGTPTVRVTINLSQDMTYDYSPRGTSLKVMLRPRPAEVEPEIIPYDDTKEELDRMISGAPPQISSYSSEDYATEYGSASATPPPFLRDLPSPNADGSANVVGDIFFRTLDNAVQIMIFTNGRVADFNDFNVLNPPRLVVDLWGLDKATKSSLYNMGWGGVKTVRIGKHADRTRVVIDLAGSRLPAYEVHNTRTGIAVTVYNKPYVNGGFRHQIYVSQSGDTFRSIAQEVYGNSNNWERLMTANRDRFTSQELREMYKNDGNIQLGVGLKVRVPTR